MDSAYQKALYRHIEHHLMTIDKKNDFYCVYGGHLGFMQIVGVAQSCRSGNQAKFVLEHIFITNQQKNFIVHNISRFLKFQMDYILDNGIGHLVIKMVRLHQTVQFNENY